MQIKYLYMLSIVLFTITVVLAAVSGLRLHSNFQLEWRFHNGRTPHCAITTYIQPATETKAEGLFHVDTEAPLYHSSSKKGDFKWM